MKDTQGNIIYVGKSRKLKNRVSSYFVKEHTHYKTAKMVSQVADFDYILCDTEMEALTLENTLIKKYTPKYNILLKDDKSYPYIKVTNETYPRLIVTRDRTLDGGRYFGPYASASAATEVVDTLSRIFSLVSCRRVFPRDIGKERPCLYAQMGRCIAPCRGDVTPETYGELVRGARGVLAGNIRKTETTLTSLMMQAAEEEQFELAAHYRDAIAGLHHLQEKQKVVGDADENRDVFALWQDDICGVLAVLSVREGKLQNKQEFLFSASALTGEEDLTALVTTFYEDAAYLPPEVLLAQELAEDEYTLLSQYLGEKAGRKVTVRCPQKGTLKQLTAMAMANAEERAKRYRNEMERASGVMKRLGELLGLAQPPRRVEAYDISEIGQEHITAAMVVTVDGKLQNKDYRTFRMKTLTGVDDYAAMREALSRRLSHLGDGTPSLGETPDLILLDGGVGQVNVVKTVLKEMGLTIPVFGMVKDDYHKTRALTDGEGEISIAFEQAVYVYVYKLQEEVHRVAVRATMGAKGKTLKRSVLENIKGIGPKKAKQILSKMKLTALKTASVEEMVEAGISKVDATSIYAYFHKEEA
jgi:excinuclease ABC subunit C